MSPRLPVAVLLSGRGSNFQALLRARDAGRLPVEFVTVVANRAEAAGLDLARTAGITAQVIPSRGRADREAYDAELAAAIDASGARVVVLAGFMRILSPSFTAHFAHRMLNIHPSLLPLYRGLHTHQRVLDDCGREHGASVHFVTAELDGGPVIAQARVPVEPGDDAERLAARVLAQEHRLYPACLKLVAEGRLVSTPDGLRLDGRPLAAPLRLDADLAWPA